MDIYLFKLKYFYNHKNGNEVQSVIYCNKNNLKSFYKKHCSL